MLFRAAALTAFTLSPGIASNLVGHASVIDGDTLEIHGTRIRLWGIDAPESSQLCRGEDSLPYRCGAKAANELDAFIAGRAVSCEVVGRDVYAGFETGSRSSWLSRSTVESFHLTETKPYKQAFVLAQVVKIGEGFTPFFGFYEGSRTYPVTIENGSTVQVPAVKFLKQVQAGNINCPTLPTVAAEVAQHYVMLCRELIMEEIRLAKFNGEPPSRQRCLYACENVEKARYWKQFVGADSTICELTCTGTIHRADASLLLGDSEPLSVTRERARRYWRGDAGESPQWETLFEGEAKVTAIGL